MLWARAARSRSPPYGRSPGGTAMTMKVFLGAAAAAAIMLAGSGRASAQISSATSTNAGSTCTGANHTTGSCASSTQVLTSNGSTFQSRYAWNVNADVG